MIKKIVFLFICLNFNQFFSQNITINKDNATVVFDGNGNEVAWNAATWKSMDQTWMPFNNVSPFTCTFETGKQLVAGTTDFSGRYKIIWNSVTNTLNVLVEIQDDVFISGYTQPNGDYYNYDILEVFIDENQSGGNHLFDSATENAENAFAYHMVPTPASVGQFYTTMIGAMDIYGTSYNVTDYKNHFPNFAFKNNDNGSFVYEFSLKLYKDNYNGSNEAAALKTLTANDLIGISVAYCDNDQNDKLRDHFFSGTVVDCANNNNSYINASLFGKYILGQTLNNVNFEKEDNIKIYPNPFENQLEINFNNFESFKETSIIIVNTNGQTVLTQKLNSQNSIIATENMQNGVYFYKITNDTEILSFGKLVK